MPLSRAAGLATLACAIALVSTAACRRHDPNPEPSAASAEAPYAPTATIKDLMLSVVDPSADVVWLAVTAEFSNKGLIEMKPVSDDEWIKVRHGAITLVEATNLLLMPGRRVARPGEKSETPGVELEPEEMDALIATDRAGWNTRVQALRQAAEAALGAIDAKDADKLFELGEQIEHACEGCHKQYWYPNEVLPEFPADFK